MSECIFSFAKYSRYRDIPPKCTEFAVKNNLCKFHHPKYLNIETENEILELFQTKLIQCQNSDKPLICIGYHLPRIELMGIIHIPIFFLDSTIVGINCCDTEFKKQCWFMDSKFNDEINFTDTKFSDANFRNMVAGGKSNFTKSKFYNEVSFLGTVFLEESIFLNALFVNKPQFANTEFHKKTNFTYAIFEKGSDFFNCTFVIEGEFIDTKFQNETFFKKIKFYAPEKIDFDCSLQTVSFLQTNIEKIRFGGNVEWGTEKDPRGNRKDKFKIYDERILEKKFKKEKNKKNDATVINGYLKDQNLESILEIYRKLRDNYDLNMKYEDSGNFFIRESEMKRIYHFDKKFKKKNWIMRNCSLAGLYNLLSRYGESYSRPLYVVIGALIFGMFYFGSSNFSDFSRIGICTLSECILRDGMIRAINAFLPFGNFVENPNWIDFVLKFIIFPIGITSFIAIRRKFERRLRH